MVHKHNYYNQIMIRGVERTHVFSWSWRTVPLLSLSYHKFRKMISNIPSRAEASARFDMDCLREKGILALLKVSLAQADSPQTQEGTIP